LPMGKRRSVIFSSKNGCLSTDEQQPNEASEKECAD
jgi:hypothetical protein